jgi:hypothetical protein
MNFLLFLQHLLKPMNFLSKLLILVDLLLNDLLDFRQIVVHIVVQGIVLGVGVQICLLGEA